MENVTLVGAFLAGLLSFLSPCVLPMLPTFSAILAGGSRRPYVSVTAFLTGFTTMFILMGLPLLFWGSSSLNTRRSSVRQGPSLSS